MQYVVPKNIEIINTNVPVDNLNEWDPGTFNTYDEVKVSSENKKYMFAGVDGTSSEVTPSLDPIIWSKGAPLNPYALTELGSGAVTSNPESIDFTFNAINTDTIHFDKVEATEIYVKMEDSSGAILYEATTSLIYDDLQDFGDYLFSEQELSDKLTGNVSQASLDLIIASMSEQDLVNRMTINPPIYYDALVTVSIRNHGSIAKCENFLVGRKRDLGISIYDFTIENKSTTKRDRDPNWGTVDLKKGVSYKIVDVPVLLKENVTVDIVQRRLEKIDGEVCLFLADDRAEAEYNSANIVGFFNDFEMPIVPGAKVYNLRLETK